MTILTVKKLEYLEEINLFVSFFLLTSSILVTESIFYIHHKAAAKLFVSIKVASLQEKQLRNLLDTVPDKVLICSQSREGHTLKSYYNNR